MALIQWNDNLSVNVAVIDKQHQKLVSMINELSDAMKQGKGKDVSGKILNSLISYTATHFQTEEKYFDLYGYPEASNHKKEHLAFVQKVSKFKDDFEKGRLLLTIELMNFLSDWLKNHITRTDKNYSPFFKAKGLK
jgi:hemerythrin